MLGLREVDAPTLDGFVAGRFVFAWCDHCLTYHRHCHHARAPGCGYEGDPRISTCSCPIGAGDGHRIALCISGPYRATGYLIREIDYATDDETQP